MRQVLVAGIGSTPFGRQPGVDIQDLAILAADAAIQDAGLDRGEVGALYLGNFVSGVLTGQEVLAGLVADGLGLKQIPCTKVEGACASGGIAFRHAWLAVATGQCDVALAVGVEKMSHADTPTTTGALNCAMDNRSDGLSGLTFPGLFGLAWHQHAERYGTTRAQVSAVVKKNKANGLLNPLAHMGADVGDDQINQSAMICDPLRLLDCCPVSDGAAAVLLVAADRRHDIASTAIAVAAAIQTRGSARIAGHADLCSFDATVQAAKLAYEFAGIGPAQIDLVELHDCFSIAEIIDSEDLGFVPWGEGASYAAEGRTAVGGDRPINASGGLLSKGHPVGATGLGQIFEVVRQLRGDHPNQVRNAVTGLTHNLGGTGVACSVTILRRTDA